MLVLFSTALQFKNDWSVWETKKDWEYGKSHTQGQVYLSLSLFLTLPHKKKYRDTMHLVSLSPHSRSDTLQV